MLILIAAMKLSDMDRGYLLELLVTKLLYRLRRSAGTELPNGLQIIGMSATIPNADQVAAWLGATYYATDYRPVPLFRYLKACCSALKGVQVISHAQAATSGRSSARS